jgi:hypothetical protein
VVGVEREDRKDKDSEPKPIALKLKESTHNVYNEHRGKCITHMIKVVSAKGECLKTVCLLFVSSIKNLMKDQRYGSEQKGKCCGSFY